MRIFKVLLAGFVLLSATTSSAKIVAWPQEFASDDGSKVVIYQPQVESFSGNDLEARAAVSVTMQGSSAPVFGAIWIVAKLDTDLSARTAVIRNIDVSDVRFAESSSEQQENLAKLIESKVNGASLEIAVDQLLSGLNTSGVDPAVPPKF